ncbi:hypothetical protein F5J12DRAFT_822335 [Pisolithus orientalis]|uniref:uncharacterized protein n=1 Tax=Pisolithus orientalis TaxID=936130 RepID=UPI0022259CCD|nr:uncharacterized protein F5J12DRAFT_822335 [Pisolithus orientalis]KAI6010890.1 hypothetical protein F5J12DRAFT_822335 [Pisolithus orientalis]
MTGGLRLLRSLQHFYGLTLVDLLCSCFLRSWSYPTTVKGVSELKDCSALAQSHEDSERHFESCMQLYTNLHSSYWRRFGTGTVQSEDMVGSPENIRSEHGTPTRAIQDLIAYPTSSVWQGEWKLLERRGIDYYA